MGQDGYAFVDSLWDYWTAPGAAAASRSRVGTASAWLGGQSGFPLVITTRPRPAGGRNRATSS
jgi:hypothetical protein